METRFLVHLVDVSLRSLPLAMAGFALVRIARLKSAAQVHAVWTTVLLGMVLLFFAGPSLKPLRLRVLPARRVLETQAVLSTAQVLADRKPASPLAPISVETGTAPERASLGWREVAFWIYAVIALAMLGRLLVGAWLARRLRKGSMAVDGRFYETSKVTVPLTVGWIKPRILLPSHWRDWSQAELEAILLHESLHVRRRDSAIGLLAGVNRCVFWFHPLAWWLEQKLALLAEQACDEACVHSLKNRRQYAQLLMELAADAEEAGGRLSRHVFAMARPSQVHRRIDAILDESRRGHRGMTRLGWTAALVCGVPVIYAAGTLRVEARPVQIVHLPLPALPPALPGLIAQGTQPGARPAPIQPRANPAPAAPVVPDGEIFIPFTVTDNEGRTVPGLSARDFRASKRDDQWHATTQEQTIDSLWQGAGHSAVALVINSPNDMPQAVNALQTALDPRDDVFVTRANLSKDADPKELLDLVSNAIGAVKERSNPAKAVVVITHGGSNIPWSQERDLSALIRYAGNTLICFVDIQEPPGAEPHYTQVTDMQTFTPLLGAYVPVASPAEVIAGLTQIATQLRNTYWLGFVPLGSGSRIPPQVDVDMPDLRLHFSRLYFPR